MDHTSGEDISSPLEQEKLEQHGDNDGNDDDLALNWMEPTPGSLRYTLQLRVEHYIEIQRAERSKASVMGFFGCGGAGIHESVFDIFPLEPVDTVEKRVTRNLLLQEIDAIQSRMDHPQRPIWKYIIGLLVTGALVPSQSYMSRIEGLTIFGDFTNILGATTKIAASGVEVYGHGQLGHYSQYLLSVLNCVIG